MNLPFTNLTLILYSFVSLIILSYIVSKSLLIAISQFKRLNDV